MRLTLTLILAAAGPALPARGCDIALMLAIDVSGSIDRGEYRLQTEGLAAGLADPEVAAALAAGRALVAVVQWSSVGQQRMVLPWTRIAEPAEAARMAQEAAGLPRAFAFSDTAPGDFVAWAMPQFDGTGGCRRRVIDISGDGPINAGRPVTSQSIAAHRQGIEINAIAIEEPGAGIPITEFYRRYVITPGGFVVTARGLADYAPTLRMKLLREIVAPTG
ncbi:DUF1194 domain-containing protein [Frigidibacter oleivorans]|uniref:DUF1194 domain-containing protein n=1 Tax=Frigidibacter oleivorans TaxID=2487129 RepID=UPI001F385E2F|nr:DUF1194 domain-containing protein [Frigidibacter oleivorans]